MEVRFRRANGEYRWIVVDGVPLCRDGQVAGYIGSCVDVTEKKLSAELLQESEQRLQAAQQLARVGSWHWGLVTNEVACSEECIQIVRQPKDYKPSLETLLEMITPRDRA
jgi:PAS domain-containing protein